MSDYHWMAITAACQAAGTASVLSVLAGKVKLTVVISSATAEYCQVPRYRLTLGLTTTESQSDSRS
jgi:hypothetical protein